MADSTKKPDACLVLNLGNSDLSVQVEENGFFFPLEFSRNEPNLNKDGLTDTMCTAWKERIQNILKLKEDLHFSIKELQQGEKTIQTYEFREVTEKLSEAYEGYPDKWHPRIRTARIEGLIKKAGEHFTIKKVYLIATDQDPPFKLDTVFLFSIVKMWMEKEGFTKEINKVMIPKDIKPHREQDRIQDFYYRFFTDKFKEGEILLVSAKGGTPLMQNAIKIEALMQDFPKLLFIDPELVVKDYLEGKPSECTLKTYWRSVQNHKFGTVEMLLEKRWDYSGAREVIRQWKDNTLDFLNDFADSIQTDADVKKGKEYAEKVLNLLELGACLMDQDHKKAEENIGKIGGDPLGLSGNKIGDTKIRLLNLYLQCRIYWELEGIASFLVRLGSFYEVSLNALKDLTNANSCILNDKKDQTKGHKPWNKLNKKEKIESINNTIDTSADNNLKRNAKNVIKELKKLDLWYIQRNNFIHEAKGLTRDSMKKWKDSETGSFASHACEPDQIMDTITRIMELIAKDIKDIDIFSNLNTEVKNRLAEARKIEGEIT